MSSCVVVRALTRSSVLDEADLLSILSESLSAHHDVVLSDETEVAASDAAAATILTELAGV